ncbi:MAG: hypothetical protein ACO3RV_01830 [Luteolibacter sp.]
MKFIRIFLALLCALALPSCNSFIGVSRDMQQLGSAMETVGLKCYPGGR